MSSSEPLRTRALAEKLAASGLARLVDAPVSGGVGGAERGTLTIMAGGEADTIADLAEVLSVLGRVRHTGPVGSGHALKALNNLLSATHLLATSEAMVAGQEFGLDPHTMLEVFNASSGRSGSTENKWPNFVLPGGYDSGFGLGLMLKDMKIATQLAAPSTGPAAWATMPWSCGRQHPVSSAPAPTIPKSHAGRATAPESTGRPARGFQCRPTSLPRPAGRHFSCHGAEVRKLCQAARGVPARAADQAPAAPILLSYSSYWSYLENVL